MGGCAGKNKSKKSDSNTSTSNPAKEPKSRTKNKNSPFDTTSSQPEKLPSSNGLTVTNNANNTKLNTEQNTIDPGMQTIINSQNGINNMLNRPATIPVISVNDSELETELAKLVYGNPEKDYAENPPFASTIKSTEV